MNNSELWHKYIQAALKAARYEGTLQGLLSRLKSGEDIKHTDEFMIKQIEDILTPTDYNVRM